MSFFENLPQMPEPPEEEKSEHTMPEWFGPPQQVVGAIVPLVQGRALAARTGRAGGWSWLMVGAPPRQVAWTTTPT